MSNLSTFLGGSLPKVSEFTASGSNTFTTPSNVSWAQVLLAGGGGGGGGVLGSTAQGGGGGGGQVQLQIIIVVPGTSYTVTIGAGGAGQAGLIGLIGGTSTFGSLITAVGGGPAFSNVQASGAGGWGGGVSAGLKTANGMAFASEGPFGKAGYNLVASSYATTPTNSIHGGNGLINVCGGGGGQASNGSGGNGPGPKAIGGSYDLGNGGSGGGGGGSWGAGASPGFPGNAGVAASANTGGGGSGGHGSGAGTISGGAGGSGYSAVFYMG